ncbi:MAG: DUF512 domain-containing protein [Clostridia bacterium]|nr:DUF512 domain-containing protein [Clostridia bacterium]
MSVTVKSVEKGSRAYKSPVKKGNVILKINNNEIMDVLDYRFYQQSERLTLEYINSKGKIKSCKIKKKECEELGFEFDTYLMDKKHSCRNKCIFCFIDQLPKGLRDTLYFKDDDSRLSFLFGNYITLTNITEHEIERIIKMHISPINISVHTTNPELRVKMMNNKNAGRALDIMKRFNQNGIKLNCQLVLCPDINDSKELERSLCDLLSMENVECVAAVPVGLSGHREGLFELKPYTKEKALDVIKIIDEFGDMCFEKYGQRRVFAADEFYIKAGLDLPDASYYEEFLQLENGVGLVPLFKKEAKEAIDLCDYKLENKRSITVITGEAAYPFIKEIVDNVSKKWDNLECKVKAIKNNFFGGEITVAGLVTATDIEAQLKGEKLGEELLIPSVMLRDGGDMFLDSVTVEELSENLNVKITAVDNDGFVFLDKILGKDF